MVQFGIENLIENFKSLTQAMLELKVQESKTLWSSVETSLPDTLNILWRYFLNLIVKKRDFKTSSFKNWKLMKSAKNKQMF